MDKNANLNILYILQQSVYDNNNKWTSADSNINMMVGIITELLEKTEWDFYILIAPIKDFSDISSYSELLDSPRVHFIEYTFIVDAFLNRQHFNVTEFSNVFYKLPTIDIIWNNLTEISRNIKTFIHYKKFNTKLITCCYWMDTPEINEPKVDYDISYQYRQFDGFLCSDICAFTCKSTAEAFFVNVRKVYNDKFIRQIRKKSVIWDFGFSSNEASSYRIVEKFKKKTIVFGNRLSGINYTHHLEFIEAVNALYKDRQDFQVIFTNPSGKYSFAELKELITPLCVYKESILSRKEYFELLWKSDISIHLFEKERYGGCFHRESVFCDNLAICLNIFEYNRIHEDTYPYYVNSNFDNFKEILNHALDSSNYYPQSALAQKIKRNNLDSSFELVSDIVINNINVILGETNE